MMALTKLKWRLQHILREKGRRTCGYCGWGWVHRDTCPLTGRIAKPGEGWQA